MNFKKLSVVSFAFILLFSASTATATYGVQTKTSHCLSNLELPDPSCTPGATLTTSTKIICVSGYTKTVRNVSEKTKKQVFAEYGIPYKLHSNYEVDHLISLELGGSNDISNLFPESYNIKNGAKIKDKFENYLHDQVCKGKMSIEDAQMQISSNWLQYYSESQTKNKVTSTKVKTQTAIPTVTNQDPIATAKCKDGTYYYASAHQGACSRHGGVNNWYK